METTIIISNILCDRICDSFDFPFYILVNKIILESGTGNRFEIFLSNSLSNIKVTHHEKN